MVDLSSLRSCRARGPWLPALRGVIAAIAIAAPAYAQDQPVTWRPIAGTSASVTAICTRVAVFNAAQPNELRS